ncbi:ABC transporter substrate-binding protein [Roseovarius nitratireducens]|uniref:ABC transporter substrate-binding protein n=1 Tax=Roseovarius nitratireducens TaxID=2044597 RepID=UPI000CE1ACD8|nr:glycine betaine ABC transporter substrate-binding protein [Roseovarius nitratireducens]
MKAMIKLTSAIPLAFTGPAVAADLVIGQPNWPSANATAHILKVAIEQYLGLEVELQNGTNPIIFEAMHSGAMDVHPEVWMPNQKNLHDTYVKDKGSVVMNPNGVESFQGMCVDQATADEHGITAIEDLTDPDIAALFDSDGDGIGEIWIGAPGWNSTNVERVRARSYGYNQTFELVATDETVAYAELDNAIKTGEPWAGFCYTPHYVFALHDMQVLQEPPHDPDKWNVLQPTDDPDWLAKSDVTTAWDKAYLHVYYARALESSHPNVAALLSNVKFDTQTVTDMTYALVIDGKEPLAYAEEWVAANEDAVLGWMTE